MKPKKTLREKIAKIVYSIKPWDEMIEQTLNDRSAKYAIDKIVKLLSDELKGAIPEELVNDKHGLPHGIRAEIHNEVISDLRSNLKERGLI